MMEYSKIRFWYKILQETIEWKKKMNDNAMIRNWYYQITHLIQNTKRKWKQTEEVVFLIFV